MSVDEKGMEAFIEEQMENFVKMDEKQLMHEREVFEKKIEWYKKAMDCIDRILFNIRYKSGDGGSLSAKVISIVSAQLSFEISKLTESTDLVDEASMDSLDLVELVMAIEEEFDIQISDDESEGIRTVKSLIKLVDKHINS